ncbi:Crp/Fnr family transcriptional regulator [Angelakisella massiliensis]|uniref:Crp/Fnr family transcriptional regulator n=1 Tax=Angelakisella massiliensis TaxID=1871018 RepID=UPI001F2D225F|nr:Crp/Fnr family transcriptional regulator [Angelakisella massiliensis]
MRSRDDGKVIVLEMFERSTLMTSSQENEQLEALLAPVSQRMVYPPKHIFQMPGETIDGIYYIKSGRTKHYMDNNEGCFKILYTLSSGWFFGETALFLGKETSLYSQTETKTTIYLIPASETYRLMRENELFRDTLLRCFAHKMLILRYEIGNLAFNSCKNRLKRLFCAAVERENMTDPGWYNLRIHYTHSELGEIVGGARVTISRQLTELCNEGFIRIINRRIQVSAEQYHKYMQSSR